MKNHFFTSKMKMADIVAANHNLILVLPRFGIKLGFGEQSLQEVCDRNGLPADFVLMVFNVYTFEDYLPDDKALKSMNLTLLIPYLQSSHHYYLNERLPHIKRHLETVANHAGDRYGTILKQFFADYEKEVQSHFECEEQEVFGKNHSDANAHFADNHSDLVDKLSDLTQIVYKYIPGDSVTEELNELVFGIMQLSSDLEKHALLEEKILLPYCAQLERRDL